MYNDILYCIVLCKLYLKYFTNRSPLCVYLHSIQNLHVPHFHIISSFSLRFHWFLFLKSRNLLAITLSRHMLYIWSSSSTQYKTCSSQWHFTVLYLYCIATPCFFFFFNYCSSFSAFSSLHSHCTARINTVQISTCTVYSWKFHKHNARYCTV